MDQDLGNGDDERVDPGGSIIAPPIIGLILTKWPVQLVFGLFVIIAAIGAVGTWLLPSNPSVH